MMVDQRSRSDSLFKFLLQAVFACAVLSTVHSSAVGDGPGKRRPRPRPKVVEGSGDAEPEAAQWRAARRRPPEEPGNPEGIPQNGQRQMLIGRHRLARSDDSQPQQGSIESVNTSSVPRRLRNRVENDSNPTAVEPEAKGPSKTRLRRSAEGTDDPPAPDGEFSRLPPRPRTDPEADVDLGPLPNPHRQLRRQDPFYGVSPPGLVVNMDVELPSEYASVGVVLRQVNESHEYEDISAVLGGAVSPSKLVFRPVGVVHEYDDVSSAFR